MLAMVILRYWQGLSANAVAPPIENPLIDRSALAFYLAPRALPRLPSASAGKAAIANEPARRFGEQIIRADTQPGFEVKESGSPRLGPPIVPGAAILLEAWPGADVPEEFVPSIQAIARPTPLETGDAKPPR